MKLYAQHGFGPKDKIKEALDRNIIDGVVLSPRYLRPEKIPTHVKEIQERGGRALLDPEFFATGFASNPNPNLGSLEDWSYFVPQKRSRLISGSAVSTVIQSSIEVQEELGLDACIAPNLFVRQADSIDTAISLNFLNQTKPEAQKVTDKPVYGSIAIHRDALLSNETFRDILDGLTALDSPPDGYYVIVGSSEQQSTGNFIRSDLYQPEVIAAWMYINYVLSLNGSKVINGYCFMLTPLLAICGAQACAYGWSSGLRKFCINKYVRQARKGGNQPNARYLSNPLLSFIKQTDYDNYKSVLPSIANDLPMDQLFDARDANQTEQALQMWEATSTQISATSHDLNDIVENLGHFSEKIDEARQKWSYIQASGFRDEIDQNLERLDAMSEGIQLFIEWAELA